MSDARGQDGAAAEGDLFRSLLESAPDAMVIVDDAGHIVLVNAETERLFGYPREELVGRPVEILVPDDVATRHGAHRERFAAAPHTRPMGAGLTLFAKRKDGSHFPVEISLSPLVTAAGRWVTSTIRDVTERKRAEQMKVELREKELLLKEIHHRVKNNLQIISSLLTLQARTLKGSDKGAAALLESRERIQAIALVHEKLYSSTDLGRTDLADYLRDLVRKLRQGLLGERVDVEVEVRAPSFPTTLDVAIPCGLIVNELATNALKYAFTSGKGKLSVRVERDGQAIALVVEDDGRGLPAEVDPSSPATLGLRIVSSLVRQLHGRLELARPERGTRFTIHFDAQEAHA